MACTKVRWANGYALQESYFDLLKIAHSYTYAYIVPLS